MAEWRKSSFSGENTNCVEVGWQKSSFSGVNTDCVEVGWHKSGLCQSTNCAEVALAPVRLGVRDSKDITIPPLFFPVAEWHVFVASLK